MSSRVTGGGGATGSRAPLDQLVLPGGLDHQGTAPGEVEPAEPRPGWGDVPWRTIVASVGVVLAVALVLVVVYLASRIVLWVVIAGFFAVVLSRPVGWLEQRLHLRRVVAIGIVVALTLATVVGLAALFVLPVQAQLVQVLTDLPGTVRQAVDGEGPIGRLVVQLHVQGLVRHNQDRLIGWAATTQASLPGKAAAAARGAVTVATVAVMTCLMLGQSRAMGAASSRLVPIRHRAWVGDTMRDAGQAVSGYMIGNLLISVCAGVAAFGFLMVAGVPAALVLALFVAVADLVPLVGATIGAAAVVLAALLVSPTAAVAAAIFFALYQQFENFVLAPVVMARTVNINPLVTLLSVLLGVELFGFDGALLAIPLAGALSVIVKELWRHRPADPDELILVSRGSGLAPDDADPPG